MPDMIKELLTWANIFLSLAISVIAVCSYRNEKRLHYLWIWVVMFFVGIVWGLLYLIGIHDIMGSGIVRSAITFTLGAIVSLLILLRIPRVK
jgi:hypothetical protein